MILLALTNVHAHADIYILEDIHGRTDLCLPMRRYKEPVTAPISAALDSYEESWDNGYAMTPLPLHKDHLTAQLHDRHRNDSRPVDVHFELLRLARVCAVHA